VDNSCGSKLSNRVCHNHDAEETAPKAGLLVEHYRYTLVAHSLPDDLTQGHPGFGNSNSVILQREAQIGAKDNSHIVAIQLELIPISADPS
jgi:hypothetical protein